MIQKLGSILCPGLDPRVVEPWAEDDDVLGSLVPSTDQHEGQCWAKGATRQRAPTTKQDEDTS